MVRSEGELKITASSKTSVRGLFAQQKQVENIVEEHKDIFASPNGVPLHCQVKYSIDLTPGSPIPNNPVYRCSIL
jgi:hypothetical protein